MSKEKKVEELPPNQNEMIEFFQKERICLNCKKPFKYGEIIGTLSCARHLVPPIKISCESEEGFYLCCGNNEHHPGCQICDHSELKIEENEEVAHVPFYYVKNKIVKKPDETGIEGAIRIQCENEDGDEKTDLLKSFFKIKRIKKK